MDHNTQSEIDRIAARILGEAGLSKPPIKVEDVLGYLNLHCEYYDLTDPNLADKIKHVLKVQIDKLKGVLSRINFLAATIPGDKRIFIDKNIPSSKLKWASLHEAAHNVLPWHKAFAHADTAEMLMPEFQLELEKEANYGVQRMIFLGDEFKKNALDSKPSITAISELRVEYDCSWESTLRHYVQNTHDVPMMLMVCPLFWNPTHPNWKRGFRYFLRSTACEERFPKLRTEALLAQFDRSVITAANIDTIEPRYIVGPDILGDNYIFRVEILHNQYDIFIIAFLERRAPLSISMSA